MAIACNDLGQFCLHFPSGRRVLHEHKIKEKLFALVETQDTQVQQQALLALQKLMLTNWAFMPGAAK